MKLLTGLRAQKTEKARRTYREQHESEFIISESAARYFKAQGIAKLPASKALQAEIEQLTREKNSLYNEYREKKENIRELQTVKSNLDKILRREPERGKGRENERETPLHGLPTVQSRPPPCACQWYSFPTI